MNKNKASERQIIFYSFYNNNEPLDPSYFKIYDIFYEYSSLGKDYTLDPKYIYIVVPLFQYKTDQWFDNSANSGDKRIYPSDNYYNPYEVNPFPLVITLDSPNNNNVRPNNTAQQIQQQQMEQQAQQQILEQQQQQIQQQQQMQQHQMAQQQQQMQQADQENISNEIDNILSKEEVEEKSLSDTITDMLKQPVLVGVLVILFSLPQINNIIVNWQNNLKHIIFGLNLNYLYN